VARIVIGVGSSHSPQLSSGAQHWRAHGERDERSGTLVGRDGQPVSYDELVRLAPQWIEPELTDEVMAEKFARIQVGVDAVGAALERAAPDVVVVVGDDQDELFGPDARPAIALFTGEALCDLPLEESRVQRMSADVRPALWAIHADEVDEYRAAPALSSHLAACLSATGFDPLVMSAQPPGRSLGHAFTYVRRRLGVGPTVRMVPILLNTYFPPNVPSPARCVRLGAVLRQAIDAWQSDVRVALVASGGLSHFVLDEDLDRQVLAALAAGDLASLGALPEARLRSGTSEILNWVVVASALGDRRLELVDYVAGYRSPAGTGVGMAFGIWSVPD